MLVLFPGVSCFNKEVSGGIITYFAIHSSRLHELCQIEEGEIRKKNHPIRIRKTFWLQITESQKKSKCLTKSARQCVC